MGTGSLAWPWLAFGGALGLGIVYEIAPSFAGPFIVLIVLVMLVNIHKQGKI